MASERRFRRPRRGQEHEVLTGLRTHRRAIALTQLAGREHAVEAGSPATNALPRASGQRPAMRRSSSSVCRATRAGMILPLRTSTSRSRPVVGSVAVLMRLRNRDLPAPLFHRMTGCVAQPSVPSATSAGPLELRDGVHELACPGTDGIPAALPTA